MAKKMTTMKVDRAYKRTMKTLSAELDQSMVKLTETLSKYKEELKEILKK